MRKTITVLAMLAAPLALSACNKTPEATEEIVATESAATEEAAPDAAATEAATDAASDAAAAAAAEGDEAADGQSTTSGVQPIKK